VGYEKIAARIIRKVVLKPFDGIVVKMVGGLIKEDNVRLGDEERRERYPRSLSTGEAAKRSRRVNVAKVESPENSLKAMIEIVSASPFELVSEFPILLQ
jgi:hypothetical protein